MIHHPLSSLTTMPSSPDSSPNRRFLSNQTLNPKSDLSSPSSHTFPSSSCTHSPSAAFDLLILILVLLSSTFLITSSVLHIFRSLSHILPITAASIRHDPLPFLAGFILLIAIIAALEVSCYRASVWSRRCENQRCRGLRKAVEFDVQLQTEDCIRFISSGTVSASAATAAWKEIDELPWKGGQQGNNPDYECLRAELRGMAPPNGRAVLLFRSRCGCPVAKLEAWSQKRGRRHKRVMANLTLESGGTQ